MNDIFYTQNGDRPDLGAIEVNPPEGYIGSKLLPIVPVADKSGTVFYSDLEADSAAQTGRSAGAAPTNTQIATTSTTYTCAEVVKRAGITPDEVKQMGGIAKADEVGAKWAKRQVMKAIETAQAAVILKSGSSADDSFDPAKLLEDAQVAADAVRLYEGRTVLATSTKTLKKMVQAVLGNSTYGQPFSRLVTGTSPAVAAQGLNIQSWANGLALWLGVDEVLLGDDAIWDASAVTGRFAIARIDNSSDPISHKYMPVLGKTFQFLPDGANPMVVKSVADLTLVNNFYDCYAWYNVVTLNTGGLYVFDGVI